MNKVKLNKPYPQEEVFNGCIKPDYTQSRLNSDVIDFYNKWKTNIEEFHFTNGAIDDKGKGYILRADSNGDIVGWNGYSELSTQSEAHGYSMIILTLMAGYEENAKALFDGFCRIFLNYPSIDNNNLMSWTLPRDGDFSRARQASATDGDLDIAYSLILASIQWGGGPDCYPEITYLDTAKKVLSGLKQNNVIFGDGDFYPRIGTGDHFSLHNFSKYSVTRSSDFMLGHFELFYSITGDSLWKDISNVIRYSIIPEMQRGDLILPPDFMGNMTDKLNGIYTFKGMSDEHEGQKDDEYFYNACRFPWRYSMAYAHYGIEEAGKSIGIISNWLVNSNEHCVDGRFSPGSIRACYSRKGHIVRGGYGFSPDKRNDSAFCSPFMSGLSVSGEHKDHITSMWKHVIEFKSNYYSDTLTLLNLLFVSGNWWKPEI